MDFIDLTKSPEESAGASRSMPPPLLPPVENFDGRLSIGGDPFEKMLNEAKLHNDPFECLPQRAPGMSLTTNFCDLENFLQESPTSLNPNDINRAFLFCDISPIMNSSNEQASSVFNKAFMQMSLQLPAKASNAPPPRKRTESEPVTTVKGCDERKSRSVTVEKMKTPEVSLWHSIAAEVQEDLTALTPPPLLEETDDEDSLENLKIPILEQLNATEEQSPDVATSPEKLSASNSVLETSAVVEDLRRRMKSVLDKRITLSDLDVTERSMEGPRILRQETFNIDKKTPAPTDESFMEKLMVMCGEHNVSIVQDPSQMEKNQSMVVVFVNGDEQTKTDGRQHKRRNSFCSDIPRATLSVNDSGNRRRRSVTTAATPEVRNWKCPVGRVLPSPNFRGQPLKLRTAADAKPRATMGPMRAVRPTPTIQVSENETPPKRVTKRRSLVITSTPKPVKSPMEKLIPAKSPLHRRQSSGQKKPLVENNRLHTRYTYTPSK